MVTGVMDHRVLGNRSCSYLAMEQLEEALRDAELCCKLRPCWAKVKREVGAIVSFSGLCCLQSLACQYRRPRPGRQWVCVCHDSRSNGLLPCTPNYPHPDFFYLHNIRRQSSHVLWCWVKQRVDTWGWYLWHITRSPRSFPSSAFTCPKWSQAGSDEGLRAKTSIRYTQPSPAELSLPKSPVTSSLFHFVVAIK